MRIEGLRNSYQLLFARVWSLKHGFSGESAAAHSDCLCDQAVIDEPIHQVTEIAMQFGCNKTSGRSFTECGRPRTASLALALVLVPAILAPLPALAQGPRADLATRGHHWHKNNHGSVAAQAGTGNRIYVYGAEHAPYSPNWAVDFQESWW